MRVVHVSDFNDALVLHFQTDGQRINAYTLASTLISLADAAKAANSAINHGYDVEVVVEALGSGSFRAKIRTVYTIANNLFSNQLLHGILLSVLATFVYEKMIPVDETSKLQIDSDEVVIQRGDNQVIIPRQVFDASRDAEKNAKFVDAISRTMETISDDERISGFGFVTDLESPSPDIIISRSAMQAFVTEMSDEPETRVIHERCTLVLIDKAYLKKSRRSWDFVRDGVHIEAPITDDKFYAAFSSHEITIAPGDELEVLLVITQKKDRLSDIFANQKYTVAEVFRHVPGLRQPPLGFEPFAP